MYLFVSCVPWLRVLVHLDSKEVDLCRTCFPKPWLSVDCNTVYCITAWRFRDVPAGIGSGALSNKQWMTEWTETARSQGEWQESKLSHFVEMRVMQKWDAQRRRLWYLRRHMPNASVSSERHMSRPLWLRVQEYPMQVFLLCHSLHFVSSLLSLGIFLASVLFWFTSLEWIQHSSLWFSRWWLLLVLVCRRQPEN